MQYGAEKNIYNLKEELMTYLDNPSQRYKKYKFNQFMGAGAFKNGVYESAGITKNA